MRVAGESETSATVEINKQQENLKGYKIGAYNYEREKIGVECGGINYNFDEVENATFTDELQSHR